MRARGKKESDEKCGRISIEVVVVLLFARDYKTNTFSVSCDCSAIFDTFSPE